MSIENISAMTAVQAGENGCGTYTYRSIPTPQYATNLSHCLIWRDG